VLVSWIAGHARFAPEREALFDAGTGRRWTYAALQHEVACRVGRLRAEGVGPGERVAILAFNRGETLATLFACAELGAILVPLNWRLSAAELLEQLALAEPAALQADAAHLALARELDRRATLLDDPGDSAEAGPGAAPADPWVMMFTSGSTGRPKGALLTHGQLAQNAVNTTLACDLVPGDATLTFTPLFHTGGMNCLTTPLLHRGGRVVLTPAFDAAEALGLVARERISVLMGVPANFQLLADHPAFAASDLSTVRDALVGGAAPSLPLLRRWLERGVPLRQGFGLTEVGPNCFSLPPADALRKLGTVGKPIHHLDARLVRPDGSVCPAGEPGELCLRGPTVFGGYWRNPEATAAAVREGWFHTGDVLVADDEGFYQVRGRIKEMYISGGENVFPAEVERALLAVPGVGDAAVVAVADARWGEVGAAWVEAQPGVALDGAAVLAGLDGLLARFKRPRHVRVVDRLPRTGSGKPDKGAIRAMEGAC
jgi:fatty-acyl-CoA synthase